MEFLEKNKVVLNCYEKWFTYKDESGITRTIEGIIKPISIRQISSLQLNKCISKVCKIYAIQVTNFLNEETSQSWRILLFFKNFRIYL